MDLADALWQLWLFYWFSAAFLGTLSAVFTAWGLRAIYRKIRGYKVFYTVTFKEKQNDI